jgi:hypothetical protein
MFARVREARGLVPPDQVRLAVRRSYVDCVNRLVSFRGATVVSDGKVVVLLEFIDGLHGNSSSFGRYVIC